MFAALLCYQLWLARNRCFHEGVREPPEVIFKFVLQSVSSYDPKACADLPMMVPCISPSVDLGTGNRVNVFVDAAVRDNLSYYAVIVLDCWGKVIEAYAGKEKVLSPLEAETRAILNASLRCVSCGWPDVMIFSDCKIAVDAILARQVPSWKLYPTFLQVFNLFSSSSSCSICWVPRVNNEAAHKLAAWAASKSYCGFF
ncbi:hypothetical protein F8388_022062 [Cannabis sativa]|uniref:RNase H type-1 domain-containing protein n=1 Tax=Cannabis sativa TaxID=3483 RepID=A0A7J6G7K6_CANSA|nr:hypothetical protein F8388_022062 [Cannabis sativa]